MPPAELSLPGHLPPHCPGPQPGPGACALGEGWEVKAKRWGGVDFRRSTIWHQRPGLSSQTGDACPGPTLTARASWASCCSSLTTLSSPGKWVLGGYKWDSTLESAMRQAWHAVEAHSLPLPQKKSHLCFQIQGEITSRESDPETREEGPSAFFSEPQKRQA